MPILRNDVVFGGRVQAVVESIGERNLNIKVMFFVSMLILYPSRSYSTGWIMDNVQEVSVKYGNGCIVLVNGEVIRLAIGTDAGKAEFSMALSAQASNRKLGVYQIDGPLLGGCNTGTTIKPHSMLRILE